MAAKFAKTKFAKTKTQGIFKRGSRYYFPYRDENGKRRWSTARTIDEARLTRSATLADIARGEFDASIGRRRRDTGPTLHAYARAWIDRYHGTGKRGFREETRAEYRVLLEKYALKHFDADLALTDLSPKMVADFIGWLVNQPNGRGGTLSDKSVRNALGPLMACLATAKREGEIATNPATGSALPHRPRIEEDDRLPRPFPKIDDTETMELVVQLVPPAHRVMFELLAATGVRRSELLALEVRRSARCGRSPGTEVAPTCSTSALGRSRRACRDLSGAPRAPRGAALAAGRNRDVLRRGSAAACACNRVSHRSGLRRSLGWAC
jgi:hypothetical protein